METLSKSPLYTYLECCPLCGCESSKLITNNKNNFVAHTEEDKQFFDQYSEPVKLLQCDNCSFCYTDKLPKSPVFYEKLYSSVNYDYQFEHKYHGKKNIYRDIQHQLTKFVPSGKLLDIGTWCGTLLSFMKDTYQVQGCEISVPAATYAQSLGMDVTISSFDKAEFADESFDVITIIDVLEHLPNPRQTLEKIYRLLKPGGVVYIKVPNIEGQINKQNFLNVLGVSKEGVCQNYVHINHFSHRSLIQVLESSGFKILQKGYTKAEVWDLDFPYPYHVKAKKYIINAIRRTGTKITALLSTYGLIDIGFNIYVIAQK